MTISERFSKIRKHFSLSAAALAEIAGVTGTAIAKIESGDTAYPKSDMLAQISAKLQVNLNWLVLGEGEMLKLSSVPQELPLPQPVVKEAEPAYASRAKRPDLEFLIVRHEGDGHDQPDFLAPEEFLRHLDKMTGLLSNMRGLLTRVDQLEAHFV